MPAITIDESRWPLVVMTIVGTPTDAEVDAMLEGSARNLRRSGRQVGILDLTRADRPPPVQRKKHAAWMNENAELLRARSAGMAFVITSPLVRGILTAIMWIQPLPMEHTVVATYAEAERWAMAQLRKYDAA